MKKWIKVSLIVVAVLIVAIGFFSWYIFIGPDNSGLYKGGGRVLENPVSGLTMEEAIDQFDEDNVYYLSVIIESYNLHNAPFSSDTPKIVIYAGDDLFSIEISDGRISVERGEISGEDIIIYSTKEEVIKMLIDSNYIAESFNDGLSNVELVAGDIELAAKGYLKLYDTITG